MTTSHALRCTVLAMGAFAIAVALTPATAQQPKNQDSFQQRVRPLVENFCVDCHGKDVAEAGINLERFVSQEEAQKDTKTWLRVRDALQGRIMPPKDEPQPSLPELDRIIAWIENDFLAAQCGQQPASAPVVIRRLNRQEYNNTIRDLLGLDLRLADAFPPDDIGFGFDNVGSALNISPAHVEKYLDAAEIALQKAIVLPDAEEYSPAELIGLKTYPLAARQAVEFKHSLKPGRYLADFSLVRVGIAESVPPPRLVIGFGKDRRTVDAVQVQDETVVYRYWLNGRGGRQHWSTSRWLPARRENANVVKPKDVAANVSGDKRYGTETRLARRLDGRARARRRSSRTASRVASENPVLHARVTAIKSRLDCARQVIARFAERAFRRPVQPDEVDRVLTDLSPGPRPGRELRTRGPARPDDGARVAAVPVPGRTRRDDAKIAR